MISIGLFRFDPQLSYRDAWSVLSPSKGSIDPVICRKGLGKFFPDTLRAHHIRLHVSDIKLPGGQAIKLWQSKNNDSEWGANALLWSLDDDEYPGSTDLQQHMRVKDPTLYQRLKEFLLPLTHELAPGESVAVWFKAEVIVPPYV